MFFAKLGVSIAAMKVKLIIIGIIVALAAGGIYAWNARGEKIDELKAGAAVSKVVNTALTNTVETQQASTVITEKINVETAVEVKKSQKKHDKIATKVETKISQIDQMFDNLPKTEENKAKKELETSTTIITGLWESFCATSPTATECQATTPTAGVTAVTTT